MSGAPPEIHTPRLRLVPASAAMLRAELVSPQALAAALGAEVPAEWPPELYDADATRYALRQLEADPGGAAWGTYYLVAADAGAPAAVGIGGYRGPPNAAGEVEVGYSVVPARRRRGYAREAVDGWLAHAFADLRVARVIAHTLRELAPSIAVLRSAGFAYDGEGADPDEPSAVRYAIARAGYAGAPPARPAVRVVGA